MLIAVAAAAVVVGFLFGVVAPKFVKRLTFDAGVIGHAVLWLIGFAVVAGGAYLWLHKWHGHFMKAGKPDENEQELYAELAAIWLLLGGSILLFTAGARRYTAKEAITYSEMATVHVKKDQLLSDEVKEVARAEDVVQKPVAKEPLEWTQDGKTVKVAKDAVLPDGAEQREDLKDTWEERDVAARDFDCKPKVEKTIPKDARVGARIVREKGLTDDQVAASFGIRWQSLYVGEDGRWSTSKIQPLLWTYAVLFALLTLYLASHTMGLQLVDANDKHVSFEDLDLPDQYYLLLGGPFAAAILAKLSTASKTQSGDLVKTGTATEPGPVAGIGQVVSDDNGNTDLVDLQYFLFNLVALGFFFATFVVDVKHGFPEIPEVLFGLTSAAALVYVSKKAVERNPPAVDSATPLRVSPGDEIHIRGRNLVTAGAVPTVEIGGVVSPEVVQIDSDARGIDHLRATVPDTVAAGGADLVVIPAGGARSSAVTVTIIAPAITSVDPDTIVTKPGASLVVSGSGFPARTQDVRARLGGKALEPVTAGATQVALRLRDDTTYPTGAKVLLEVGGERVTASTLVAVRLLTISEVRPSPIPLKADEQLLVIGEGFARDIVEVTLDRATLKVDGRDDHQLRVHIDGADVAAGRVEVKTNVPLHLKQGDQEATIRVDVISG